MEDSKFANDVLLCVDDEPNVLYSLTRTFRNAPFRLITAGSGREALEIMEKEPVRVVISDQRMPGMEGTELLHRIKEHWPHVIRIILSGYTDVAGLLKAINEGEVYRFISKPWNDDALRRLVVRAMEQSKVIEEMDALSRVLSASAGDKSKVGFRVENLGNIIRMELSETNRPLEAEQISGCLEKIFNVRKESGGLQSLAGALVRQNGKLSFMTEVGDGVQLVLEFPIVKREGANA